MIDPAKLTADQGFVDGCVVMVKTVGWSERPMVYHIRDSELGPYIPDSNMWAYLSNIESIRPLTGLMAIWNFLPSKVVAICRGDDGWPEHQLYSQHPAIKDCSKYWSGLVIEYRPFWARSEK